MTPAEKRKETIAKRNEWKQKHAKIIAENIAVVSKGACPQCGRSIVRNLSLSGWWQCSQYGAVGFRVDPNKPACSWQVFTV